MGKISAKTHIFLRGKGCADGKCLYWSFIRVSKPILIKIFGEVVFTKELMEAINEDLRVRVADYIRSHPETHVTVLNTLIDYKGVKPYYYTDVEKYCSDMEHGELWCTPLEVKVLSSLFNIFICLIDLTKTTPDNRLVPAYYGEDNPSAIDCVYIYFNGKDHFDPLLSVNVENLNEEETIFDPNDQIVNDFLKKFIKKQLEFDGDVELGINIVVRVNEVSYSTDGSDDTEIISNSILPNALMKRKGPELDSIVKPPNNNNNLPILISNKYYVPNKRVKAAKDATAQIPTFYKNNSETMTMEKLIQDDDVRGESDMNDTQINQQQIGDRPMALNDEHQEEEVEGEEEPINELVDDIQDNNEINYSCESSTTEPSF